MPVTSPFACFRVEKHPDGRIAAGCEEATLGELPAGDVLIRVAYSSLNYKDALAIEGHPGVVRRFPHVPGIDLAGTVVEDGSGTYREGEEVLVTGFGLGADTWGGYAQYARVPAEWVVRKPDGLSLRDGMIYGTAGFTAALCVAAFQERSIAPGEGDVLVTGASGGVGCLSVAMLSKLGYRVVAATGKPSAHDFLMQLGAAEVVDRSAVGDSTDRPLLAGRWRAAVDVVGGDVLANVVRSLAPYGCVCACGLAGGAELRLTVYPFILRGVQLIGITSSPTPLARRVDLWAKLAGPWRPDALESVATEIELADLDAWHEKILAGEVQGRTVVRID